MNWRLKHEGTLKVLRVGAKIAYLRELYTGQARAEAI